MLYSVQPWKSGREQHAGSLPSCQQHSPSPPLQLCINSEFFRSLDSSWQWEWKSENYFYCLNLECFVSSICWELFSKQGLYLKWHWVFVCHQGSCQPAQNWQWALLPQCPALSPWAALKSHTHSRGWQVVPDQPGSLCLLLCQDAVGTGRNKEQVKHSGVLPGEWLPEMCLFPAESITHTGILLPWKFHVISQRSHLQAL